MFLAAHMLQGYWSFSMASQLANKQHDWAGQPMSSWVSYSYIAVCKAANVT